MTKKEIEKVVDKLIVRLPIGKEFPLAYELSMYFNSILSDIDLNKDKTNIVEDVSDFMIEREYIKYRPTEINEILEPKGIEAKNAGGHFKYVESLKKLKERENKQDKILDLELELRTFESKIGRKIIIAGIIISVLNFLITISTIKISKNSDDNSKKVEQVNDLKPHKGQEKILDTLK